ncbi:MAG: F420-dependent NADP oxidoreductase [Lachnoclostridium sp.]|nr:F420-dependent NADP oxidoreductase [Lachnoclostridium sp.]
MSKNSKPRLVMIGAGNVASSLAPAIHQADAADVVQVYSRNLANAQALADAIPGAAATADLDEILPDADVYLLSLSDDALKDTVAALKPNNALWLHTSGSTGMEILSRLSDSYGVFYPLQTFSKSRRVNLDTVSLFTEGSTLEVEDRIREMAVKVFKNVYHADSLTRRRMHIAAVFACNFSNYMWMIAHDLLQKHHIPFDVLAPLLRETLDKALQMNPRDGQTGPARRGDTVLIEAHAEMLPDNLREIYILLSESIIKEFHDRKA